MAESGNIAARALGGLGQGFLAGFQQAKDNEIRAAPTKQREKEFTAEAPGREADVRLKGAQAANVEAGTAIMPTRDEAMADRAAGRGLVSAQTEAARAGAIRTTAETERLPTLDQTQALTEADIWLRQGQAQEAGARGEAAAFENTPEQRGLRAGESKARTGLATAQTGAIGFEQGIQSARLALDQERSKSDVEQNRAVIRYNEAQLALKAQDLAMAVQRSQSETLEKMWVADNASKDREASVLAGLANTAMTAQGLPPAQALQQARQGMDQFMKMNRTFGDPSRYAMLNGTAQEAVTKMMQGVSDPAVPFDQKLKLISEANTASSSVLTSLLTPVQGAESRPGDGRKPLTSRAESRRTALTTKAGGGTAGAEAAERQLAAEGVLDVKVNGVSIDPTPNYSLPKGLQSSGFEFDKWAASNPAAFDRQFAAWRVKNGDPNETDAEAYDRFKLFRLRMPQTSTMGIGQGSRF